MNSSVPDNALDHLMAEPMLASTIPVTNQTPMNPASATADPPLNIIFDTPTTTTMEASSPAAIVSVPSSYTEPSKTAPEVAPSMIEVAPSMIEVAPSMIEVVPSMIEVAPSMIEVAPSMFLNFDPETGTIEQAPINSEPSSPSSSISSSIDLDQL